MDQGIVTSHQINKVEAQKDGIIHDYSEQLRNANRLKNLYFNVSNKCVHTLIRYKTFITQS